MIPNIPRRGRPIGSSQYTQDRTALERMVALCEQGVTAYRAAEKVVAEMPLSEINRKQAIDRLRKKYPSFHKEALAAAKKAAALPSASPTPPSAAPTPPSAAPTPKPQHLPELQNLRQIAREHREYSETPAGSLMKEHLIRWSTDDNYRSLIREAAAAARLVVPNLGG